MGGGGLSPSCTPWLKFINFGDKNSGSENGRDEKALLGTKLVGEEVFREENDWGKNERKEKAEIHAYCRNGESKIWTGIKN